MADAKIRLSNLPRELARLTDAPIPRARRLYALVLDGRIPAEQGSNGRWMLAHDDLPVIAERLGLPISAERARTSASA